jgi:hypothetical protein
VLDRPQEVDMSIRSLFHRRALPSKDRPLRRNVTRALTASLAATALAAPSALAQDLRSPDARTPGATQVQQRADVFTGGVRAPDWLSPDATDTTAAVAPTSGGRTADAPTAVEVTPSHGFDWTSGAIGAAGGVALALITVAAAAALTGGYRPAAH